MDAQVESEISNDSDLNHATVFRYGWGSQSVKAHTTNIKKYNYSQFISQFFGGRGINLPLDR